MSCSSIKARKNKIIRIWGFGGGFFGYDPPTSLIHQNKNKFDATDRPLYGHSKTNNHSPSNIINKQPANKSMPTTNDVERWKHGERQERRQMTETSLRQINDNGNNRERRERRTMKETNLHQRVRREKHWHRVQRVRRKESGRKFGNKNNKKSIEAGLV